MTLFRGQQSKAARDRERERPGGEVPIVRGGSPTGVQVDG